MAITVVGYGAQAVLNTGFTISPALHGSTAENDLIVSSIIAGGNRTITIDGDYTLVYNHYNSTGNMRLAVGWAIAGAAEPDPIHTISTSGSGWGSQNATYRGVDLTTPIDATSVLSELTSTATTWVPTGLTTVTNGAFVLSIVQGYIGALALGLNSGNEQGFTLEMGGADYDYTLANDDSFGQAYLEKATAGAVTMPTWERTIGTDQYWTGITIALRPAAVGAAEVIGSTDGDSTALADIDAIVEIDAHTVLLPG